MSSLSFLSLGFVILGFVPSYVPWLLGSILCAFFLTISKKGKKHLSECFLFLRHAGVGGIDVGVETVESSVFLPNVLADIFNGESVWE